MNSIDALLALMVYVGVPLLIILGAFLLLTISIILLSYIITIIGRLLNKYAPNFLTEKDKEELEKHKRKRKIEERIK